MARRAATASLDTWFRKPEAPTTTSAPSPFGANGDGVLAAEAGAGVAAEAGLGVAPPGAPPGADFFAASGAGWALTIASRVAVNWARFCGSSRTSSACRACAGLIAAAGAADVAGADGCPAAGATDPSAIRQRMKSRRGISRLRTQSAEVGQ